MIPAPFEVVPCEGGFTWRIIAACGRPLVYTSDTFQTDRAAADAAKKTRVRFGVLARTIDGGAAQL